ncbi:MAG: acyl-CoA dehydrogenase family protein [Alphaproteobacteria bacterium]
MKCVTFDGLGQYAFYDERYEEDGRPKAHPIDNPKYAGATIGMERNELLVEAMGLQGLGWEGEGFTPLELAQTRAFLRSKGNSIEGGTSEVNLNVVAKRVLGLLDHQ